MIVLGDNPHCVRHNSTLSGQKSGFGFDRGRQLAGKSPAPRASARKPFPGLSTIPKLSLAVRALLPQTAAGMNDPSQWKGSILKCCRLQRAFMRSHHFGEDAARSRQTPCEHAARTLSPFLIQTREPRLRRALFVLITAGAACPQASSSKHFCIKVPERDMLGTTSGKNLQIQNSPEDKGAGAGDNLARSAIRTTPLSRP
jgi:hypothetical protein